MPHSFRIPAISNRMPDRGTRPPEAIVNHIHHSAATEPGAAKRRGATPLYANRNSASIVAEQIRKPAQTADRDRTG
jgi:hypothetical protein